MSDNTDNTDQEDQRTTVWVQKSEAQLKEEGDERRRETRKKNVEKQVAAVAAEKRQRKRLIVSSISLVCGAVLGAIFYKVASYVFTDDLVSYYGIWFLHLTRISLALAFAFLTKKIAERADENGAKDGYYAAVAVIVLWTFISVLQTYSPSGKMEFDAEHVEDIISVQEPVKKLSPIKIYDETITKMEEDGIMMLVRIGAIPTEDGDEIIITVTNLKGKPINFIFMNKHEDCHGEAEGIITSYYKSKNKWIKIKVEEPAIAKILVFHHIPC